MSATANPGVLLKASISIPGVATVATGVMDGPAAGVSLGGDGEPRLCQAALGRAAMMSSWCKSNLIEIYLAKDGAELSNLCVT